MDTLQAIADVVYDPWIEQVPLRLYDGEKLAARLVAEKADILIVESDFVNGPVFDLALKVIGSCRGDPNNVDVAAATAAGIPVLRAPGRNADAVAELAIALMFAVNRWIVPADHDVRARPGVLGRQDPVPALPRLAARGPHGRGRRSRRGRTRGRVALRRCRHARPLLRPVQPQATHNDDLEGMLAECDVVSVHAIVTPETEDLMGAAQFAAMKPGRRLHQHRTGDAARHRRAR